MTPAATNAMSRCAPPGFLVDTGDFVAMADRGSSSPTWLIFTSFAGTGTPGGSGFLPGPSLGLRCVEITEDPEPVSGFGSGATEVADVRPGPSFVGGRAGSLS